jgi:hypothetical protein
MVDLWDPGKRSKKCLSCHIGNSEEGKVVTHEMYAAGHPPLPSVEMSAFSEFMPKHWQYLHEKPAAVLKELDYKPGRIEQVELVMVGAAASLRESMALVAGQAKKAAGGSAGPALLDFALFDCYACHHDLKKDNWRADSEYVGQRKPGRPAARSWPTALVKLCIQHAYPSDAAAKTKELEIAMKKLSDAYSARPFGDAAAVESAARDVSKWCDDLIAKLIAANYSADDAKKLLAELTKAADAKRTDFDSARQIVWAFRSVYDALYPPNAANKPSRHSEIVRRISELDSDLLSLTLPSGQDKEIIASLPRTLRLLGDYDPARFRERMEMIATLLN